MPSLLSITRVFIVERSNLYSTVRSLDEKTSNTSLKPRFQQSLRFPFHPEEKTKQSKQHDENVIPKFRSGSPSTRPPHGSSVRRIRRVSLEVTLLTLILLHRTGSPARRTRRLSVISPGRTLIAAVRRVVAAGDVTVRALRPSRILPVFGARS